MISAELDHLALHGFGQVIIDENDRVCLIAYFWDHCANLQNMKQTMRK